MSGIFFGWRVVAAAFVLAALGWGLGFYGPPIYLHAVREGRGWSLALVSTAVTLHFLVGAAVIALLPRLYRRFGVAAVVRAGSVALALGVMGWALAREPWQLFLATLLSGGGWVTMGAAAVNAIVTPWFDRQRPAALAMAYNGATIGGVVFSPLWVVMIGALGFPLAAAVVGGITILAMWGLAGRYFGASPEAMGVHVGGGATGAGGAAAPAWESWRDRRFVTVAVGMALGLFAQIGLLAHLFSMLVPAMGASLAGVAAGVATAAALVGRNAMGWLMRPGADRRVVVTLCYAVQAAGAAAFLLAGADGLAWLWVGVVLFGSGIGNATSLPPLIAQAEFSRADAARVVPAMIAIAQAAYAFAPAVFGLVREWAPGGGVFGVAMSVQAAAAVAMLAGRRKP